VWMVRCVLSSFLPFFLPFTLFSFDFRHLYFIKFLFLSLFMSNSRIPLFRIPFRLFSSNLFATLFFIMSRSLLPFAVEALFVSFGMWSFRPLHSSFRII
jgi:hypothetical protein